MFETHHLLHTHWPSLSSSSVHVKLCKQSLRVIGALVSRGVRGVTPPVAGAAAAATAGSFASFSVCRVRSNGRSKNGSCAVDTAPHPQH